jgi:hypothetical protein
MNDLLDSIIDALGGTDRWNSYEKVEATIVSGGGFFALKGMPQDSIPRRMTVWLHEERSSVLPYGAPDQRTMFTPEYCGWFCGGAADLRLRGGERYSLAD